MAQDINTFQRAGAVSNSHAGREFEIAALKFFERTGIELKSNFEVLVGFEHKKKRSFDLGSKNPAVLFECKSHNWTSGGNMPSAKITVWNESMLYFDIAPVNFRKILFVLRSVRGRESLAEYYVAHYSHLIPPGVEIWEYDEGVATGKCVYQARTKPVAASQA